MAPKTHEELVDDGIEVLLRARDFAELKLADRDELLKLGVRGAVGSVTRGASEFERLFSSEY